MVTYTVNLEFNKFAVAAEVISSSIRTLAAAGFDDREIEDIFRRAIENFHDETTDDGEIQVDPAAETPTRFALYDLVEEFENTPEKRALGRLEKRASALDRGSQYDEGGQVLAIVEQALPLAEKATEWLIQRCSELGIPVEPSKDEWLRSASDDELDTENDILFLDDWQISNDFQLRNIEFLARGYAQSGDISSFSRLLELIRSHKVIYGEGVISEIERSSTALEAMADFKGFVRGHAGNGELAQSTLLDDFVRESGFQGGTYLLEGWLQSMADGGEIQRYKRSNRWRIEV